jgi:hypothetical protein
MEKSQLCFPNRMGNCLVVTGGDWNMNGLFSPVGMMIQSDFHSIIFQKGRSTTNHENMGTESVEALWENHETQWR